MKTIDNLNFSGKKALIRVDFNVPLDKDFKITDDNRIQGALPTITKILNDGGSVILMSGGRKRGRKSAGSHTSASTDQNGEPVKRRGRPRKNPITPPEVKPKRKPGRPKKNP